MIDFEVSFNRLQRRDVDVSKWGISGTNCYLMYNEISFVHEWVWNHLEIIGFAVWATPCFMVSFERLLNVHAIA